MHMHVNVVRPKCTIVSSRNLPPVSPQSANDTYSHVIRSSGMTRARITCQPAGGAPFSLGRNGGIYRINKCL